MPFKYLLALILALNVTTHDEARANTELLGQTLYIPLYSEVPFSEGKRTLGLTGTLSVRNVDPARDLVVRRVDYYGASGVLIRSYLTAPQVIKPFAAAEFVVAESDRRGGISASFIVEWETTTPINPPLVEAIMVGAASGQGVSFTGQARVLEQLSR